MQKIINISDWEYLNEMQKAQIETDSYIHILSYLINKNHDIKTEHYQYYQKQYLDAYTKLFDIKNQLISYLKENNLVTETQYTWEVDFLKKEVYINV